MSGYTWTSVLAAVNTRVHGSFELQQQLSSGRQGGAWLVSDGVADHRAVLTWSVNASLAARRAETTRLVERLRAVGYPTPEWIVTGVLDDGVVYELVAHAEGRHMGFGELPLTRVLEAIELQAGLADEAVSSWSDYARSVVHDAQGPRARLSLLGAQGQAFSRRIDTLVSGLAGIVLPADDAVHGHLGTYNILVDKDSIAIIDLGACGPGTRALDYAWLLRQAHHDRAPDHVVNRIKTAGQQVAGEEVFTVCLLAAVLEMVAFSVDRGHTEAAAHEVRRARVLLAD